MITALDEATNPNHVYTQQNTIGHGPIHDHEVQSFSDLYFQERLSKGEAGRMDSIVAAVAQRFEDAYGPRKPDNVVAEGEAFKSSIGPSCDSMSS